MIGMDEDYRRAMRDAERKREAGEIQRRAERFAQAGAPALRAAGEALAPMLDVVATQFKSSILRARQALDVFAASLGPIRRNPARKPCAWCVDGRKRPATHTVKWRKSVVFWDDLDEPIHWPAGRVMRMCELHAKFAERYDGVKAYRFRRRT